MIVAGLDGTKGGWVAFVLRDGRLDRTHHIKGVEAKFHELADAAVIAIDVPIGFGPDRAADGKARKMLKGAASTVFSTPSRGVLEQKFRAGLGVSAQAHALGPRILYISDLALKDRRLYEAHPELSFRTMNGDQPLRHRKKTAGGVFERLELLRRHGIDMSALGEAAAVPIDDALDAAACAWTARRIAADEAEPVPNPPQERDGLRVAMWR